MSIIISHRLKNTKTKNPLKNLQNKNIPWFSLLKPPHYGLYSKWAQNKNEAEVKSKVRINKNISQDLKVNIQFY